MHSLGLNSVRLEYESCRELQTLLLYLGDHIIASAWRLARTTLVLTTSAQPLHYFPLSHLCTQEPHYFNVSAQHHSYIATIFCLHESVIGASNDDTAISEADCLSNFQ